MFRALCCARAAVRAALNSVLNTRSCSSCSGWPSQSCWQASRLSLERRPHPCSRCRARPAAAVAVCVSALISGVAAVSTSTARLKALSRLAGAGVKQMATHDGRNVHDSAQPAVHTPIDSDACVVQATQCLCRTQQCSGERRRSARRWASLATPAASIQRTSTR